MKKLPEPDLIKDIALEAGVEPSFVEKDWFAVQLLGVVAEYNQNAPFQAIFSGGTSLSKGYGLIKRFSEDLDFFVSVPDGGTASQGQKRTYRSRFLELVGSQELFEITGEIKRGNNSGFFKVPVAYPIGFPLSLLRPHLQLEMTFIEPRIPPELRPVRSLVAQALDEPAEVEIMCVSPLETAGDKLSALSWRVIARDRTREGDDPTLIRHLHDLAALEALIDSNSDAFKASALISLERDIARGGSAMAEMTCEKRLKETLINLKKDKVYQDEYDRFVGEMSYADDDERLEFGQAVDCLERIIGKV